MLSSFFNAKFFSIVIQCFCFIFRSINCLLFFSPFNSLTTNLYKFGFLLSSLFVFFFSYSLISSSVVRAQKQRKKRLFDIKHNHIQKHTYTSRLKCNLFAYQRQTNWKDSYWESGKRETRSNKNFSIKYNLNIKPWKPNDNLKIKMTERNRTEQQHNGSNSSTPIHHAKDQKSNTQIERKPEKKY